MFRAPLPVCQANTLPTAALVLGILGHLLAAGCDGVPATLTGIAVQPATAVVPKGLTDQMAGIGTFSDGRIKDLTSQVQWSSSDASAANISNDTRSSGLVNAVAQGSVVIRASLDGLEASTLLQVGAPALLALTVNAAAAVLTRGAGEQLTALGMYSDGSTQDLSAQVSWSSSNPSVATISNDASALGMLTSYAAGIVKITATLNGLTASDTLTVS